MFSSLAIAGVLAHPAWGAGPGFGWLFVLVPLFWILLFALIVGLAGRRWRRAGFGPGGHGPWAHAYAAQQSGTRSAEATLAERFAQGDIEEKEYRARLEVLRANRAAGAPESS